MYLLNKNSQIVDREDLWKGSSRFSARVALAWDEENLYFGVDVTDPQLYQPFWGRGVQNGDAFRLILDTILPIAIKPGGPTGVFDLYLSPGNFAGVKPSIYCNEDFFALRSRPPGRKRRLVFLAMSLCRRPSSRARILRWARKSG